jgi:hypothetical protein
MLENKLVNGAVFGFDFSTHSSLGRSVVYLFVVRRPRCENDNAAACCTSACPFSQGILESFTRAMQLGIFGVAKNLLRKNLF